MAYGKTNVGAMQKPDEKEFKRDERFLSTDKAGSVDLVFCPPYAENLTAPHLSHKVHYKLGRPVVCLQSWGEQCPACDTARILYNRGKAGDKQAWDLNMQIYARESYYYNVIPYVAPALLPQPIDGVTHIVGFAPPAEGVKPSIKIFRCGKKAHAQICNFLQFCGDIFDPMNCTIINLAYMKQVGESAGQGQEFHTPMLNYRPMKCRLHEGFLKMLDKTGTKIEDNSMYDLAAVLLESKPTKEEVKALVDAKYAEFFAVSAGNAVAVPNMPAFGGGPKMSAAQTQPAAAIPTPPQTSVVVNAPQAAAAVPTVTPNMVAPAAPQTPQAPPKTIDPLAAFA